MLDMPIGAAGKRSYAPQGLWVRAPSPKRDFGRGESRMLVETGALPCSGESCGYAKERQWLTQASVHAKVTAKG